MSKTDVPESLRRDCPDWRIRYAIWGQQWGNPGYATAARLAAADGSSESSFVATPEAPDQVQDATSDVSSTISANDLAQRDGEPVKGDIPGEAGATSHVAGVQYDQEPSRPLFRSPLLPPSAHEQEARANIAEPAALYHASVAPDLYQPQTYASPTGYSLGVAPGMSEPDDVNPQSNTLAASNPYLEYSYDIADYSYPTLGYANGTHIDAPTGMAGSETTAHWIPNQPATDIYGSLPAARSGSARDDNNFETVISGQSSAASTSLDSSYHRQVAELPSLQTHFDNLVVDADWPQWDRVASDEVLSQEQWLEIIAAAAQQAAPGEPDSAMAMKRDDFGGYNAAPFHALEHMPSPAPANQGQNFTTGAAPPAGLLWTDAPSVELAEWLSLPSDFEVDASPDMAMVDDGLRTSHLPGNDQLNPWSGGGASAESSQEAPSHDSWMHQGYWKW
ncbi:hypothetical protein EVJ58_g5378 [Rhodofomes roseus]|uniref:Uncharacterized protein n=1 Tax=Rhodofomes roseus TaxID=34475 RepID=A0A4Y9YEB8_9APHY|nr:hypothetical protein EVJ58_g5378 [Rhodofomes roseus]